MGDKYDDIMVVPEALDHPKRVEKDRLVRDWVTREAITLKEAERRLKLYVRSLAEALPFPQVFADCKARWNLKHHEIDEAILEVNYNMRLNRATKYAPIAAAETFGTPPPSGNYQAKLTWAQGVLAAATKTNVERQLLLNWLVENYQVLTFTDQNALIVEHLGARYVEPAPPPAEPEEPGQSLFITVMPEEPPPPPGPPAPESTDDPMLPGGG